MCVNLTRRSGCNSSSRYGYRAPEHVDPTFATAKGAWNNLYGFQTWALTARLIPRRKKHDSTIFLLIGKGVKEAFVKRWASQKKRARDEKNYTYIQAGPSISSQICSASTVLYWVCFWSPDFFDLPGLRKRMLGSNEMQIPCGGKNTPSTAGWGLIEHVCQISGSTRYLPKTAWAFRPLRGRHV